MAVLRCPSCGSSDLIYVDPNRQQCSYCGTVFTTTEEPLEYVRCQSCGFDNKIGNTFCSRCGARLGPAPAAEDNPEVPVSPPRLDTDWSAPRSQPTLPDRSWTAPTAPPRKQKQNPAVASILVTVIGSMFVPIGAPIVGLFMAYKAGREMRARGENPRLATIAVFVGWAGLAVSVFPMLAMVLAQFFNAFSSIIEAMLR